MSGISERNPFVGPRPIQQGEALHGRSTELRELYNLLQARRIVVLHSPSGAGKSSLVQAGLIPRLRAGNFDVWRTIRVNLDPAGLAGVPAATNRYVLSAMLSLEEELPAAQRRSPAQLAGLEFAAYLGSRPRRKGQEGRPIVLLFDQFEEVLTVAPWAVAEKQAFFTAVGAALDSQSIWALFLIREDFLAAFAPYRDRIPTQMANTFRLDLLGRAGAREAAVELARAGGRSFPAVDQLIHDLSTVQVQQPDGSFVAEQGPHVEPVHLQVVGRRLWAAMPEEDLSIEAKDIAQYASVSTALADYYAQAVTKIACGDIAVERALREWVGSRLIVGGIRSQVRQEAGRSAGLDNALIEPLLASYLVRSEQRAGANWFELSHDRLVEPVLQDNKAWEAANLHPLQVQAQLWESGRRLPAQLLSAQALPGATAWAQENAALLTEGEREFLEQSRKLRAEEARRRRLQKVYMLILALGAVAGLTLGSYALHMRGLAEDQMARAERLREDAVAARERAREAAWMGYVRTFAIRDPTRALLGLVEIKSTDTVPGWLQEAQDALQQPSTRTLLRGHTGSVVDAALSPDGTRVVTASTDGTARVWQVDGGGVPVVLRGHRGPVHSAAFSRDGTRIVTASADGTARVWRADGSGTAVELPGPTERADVGDYRHIRSASFSRDGERVLLLPVADGVRIWDAEGRGAPVDLRFRGRFGPLGGGYGDMAAASFSEDGTRVLTTEAEGRAAWVWRADGSGDPVGLAVRSEASRADGTQAILLLDGPIRVVGPWNTAEEVWRRSVVELKDSAGMWGVSFVDDGARVAGYDTSGHTWLWSADGRGERRRGPPQDTDHDSYVGDGLEDNGVPGPVFRPNPGWSGKALAEEPAGALVPAFAAAFSGDGRRVATVADGRARLWNADGSGAPITLYREGVLSIAWSADGERVLTLARDREGRRVFDVWNTQAGQFVAADLERHGGVVSSAWASPEGRRAWSFSAELGAAREVQIWGQDGDHARLVAELRGHADIVLSAAFGADGQRMVTGSRDGTARVWNVGGPAFAGETLQHSSPVQWASFSGDGGRIATVTYDHTVRVWDGDGRGAPREMPMAADAYGREWILVASISPDGKRVATGYYGPALLWEVDSGAVRRLEPVGEPAKPAGEAAQPTGEAAQPTGEAAQPVGWGFSGPR
ncbi:MAG: hypothetical protein IPO88_20840 [Nannocystis sp.]|uniref:AAA family ATPase n=1 Tax=Nannocystis sp. TaxID=1962667 RepID=UPI002426F026|nr:AAA family ATPase [Nannocystis sp.]MBK9755899.1 hypothetical protein [Nannocystis sp.]